MHVGIGQDPDEPDVVLADPEGKEYRVTETTNRFHATRPRLRAQLRRRTCRLHRFPGGRGYSSAACVNQMCNPDGTDSVCAEHVRCPL
jgi:hypothetical protein